MATKRSAQRIQLDELRRTWLFSACSTKELRAVASLCTPTSVRAGRVLIREGESGGECFVVLSGQAVVERGGAVLGHDVRHSVVGLLAMLDDEPNTATVTAITDMRVLAIDQRQFAALRSGDIAWSIEHRLDVIADEHRDRRAAAALGEQPRWYVNRPVIDVPLPLG
jgi:CRP-like cAMP-binding protein